MRVLGFVIQDQSDLADTEIESLFKIDKSLFAPDCVSDLCPADKRAAVSDQKRQNTGRLLLNPGWHTVFAELVSLFVQFEVSKSNPNHGRETV